MDESNIPIDIHYNKLLDWLISRRHCQHDWQKGALIVREKINDSIQDMPPVEEITKLLQGTYINYFHCLKIVDLLKATDAGKKNIFGQYSSQYMKEWQEILRLYETDGIYLAEAAQLLIRNVNYEIPSLKRQINKCQQSQKDAERKQHDYTINSSELKHKYMSACKDMGIEGKHVKAELLELAKDLPTVYERVAHSAANLKAAIAYYNEFVKFTIGREENCVKLLSYLADKGNVTVYEWRTGEAPSSIEEVKLDLDFDMIEDPNKPTEEAEIDWGAMDADEPGPAGDIDWGLTIDNEGEGIDWGQADIEIVDDKNSLEESDAGVARGTDALSLLDNTDTHNLLINDMLELSTFLEQRCNELKDSTVISSNQFESAPSSIQIDASQASAMLAAVQNILGQLTPKQMQDLILIRSSPRYVNKIAENLNKMLEQSEKLLSRSRLMVQQSAAAAEEEQTIYPKLDLIKSRTVQLQKQIAEEISKKYKNRKVNIMGEINKI